MKCIVYVSSAQVAFDERKLDDLARGASKSNRRREITGYLFFQRNTFIQYIEGNASQVTELMSKIALDERHHVVYQMDRADLVERRFPNWWMRYLTPEEMGEINLEKILADELNLANTLGENDHASEERVWRLVDLIANSGLNQ